MIGIDRTPHAHELGSISYPYTPLYYGVYILYTDKATTLPAFMGFQYLIRRPACPLAGRPIETGKLFRYPRKDTPTCLNNHAKVKVRHIRQCRTYTPVIALPVPDIPFRKDTLVHFLTFSHSHIPLYIFIRVYSTL